MDNLISTGTVYLHSHARLCVSKINLESQVVVLTDLETKDNFPVAVAEFQRDIAEGIYSREHPEEVRTNSLSRVLDDPRFKSDYINLGKERQNAINKYEQLVSTGLKSSDATNAVIKEYQLNCSERTFRRWHRDFRVTGFEGITPKHHLKGRKHRVISKPVEEVIEHAFDEHLHKSYIRVKEMHQIINQGLNKKGIAEALSYEQVRRYVNQQPWSRRILSKFDPRTRRSVGSSRARVYRSELPYQRIEVDCTQLDIFVQHSYGSKPVRPYACVAIDVATGFPLAVELCLHAPDTVHALKTMERAMYGFSKEELTNLGVTNQILYSGRPQTLVLDNGSEFKSDSFSSLAQFGIEVEYNPAYSPYRKPFVERFNRSLKDFTSGLPGSTRMPIKGGKPFTEVGIAKAAVSFDELKMLITRFVFDDYSIKPLNRHVLHCVAKGESQGVVEILADI